MAEQIGEAVLAISADTKALEAGLARARQQAEQTGRSLSQAFESNGQGPASSIRSIEALREKLNGLRSAYENVEIGSKGFRDLQREIQKAERELQQVDKTLGATFRDRAGGFAQNLLGALGVGVGLGAGAAVGGFIKSSIDQAVELETVTRKLQNTLGAQGAQGALSFTKGLANDLGLNFKVLANAYSGFTAAATAANVPLETQKGLFAAVSRAGQALGLSNDEINGSLLALQQVASKGTVQMEELRGQLGERLPIAFSAAAKGLGITQQELGRLVESGKLTAAQFFPALTKGLNELTAGAGGIPTAAQNFAKLSNAWESLQQSFGTNLLPGITVAVQKLSEALEGLSVQEKARDIRGTFGFSADQAEQLVGVVDNVTQRFALTAGNARSLLSDAVAGTKATRDIFGELNLSAQQFADIQAALPKLAEEFRAKHRDVVSDEKAAAAAAAAKIEKDRLRTIELQKQLDIQLKQSEAGLRQQGLQEELAAAKVAPQLNEEQDLRLKGRLALNEKIRSSIELQLQLQRELAKPQGRGDGKENTQNPNTVRELQAKAYEAELAVEKVRVGNRQNEDDFIRNRRQKLQEIRLEIEALNRGPGAIVSPSDLAAVKLANQSVKEAYADAGLSLVKNAQAAATSLRGAQDSLRQTERGGFQFLNNETQRRLLADARAAIQPLVDQRVIRSGLDISTPDKLFAVASFAESFTKARDTLDKALTENAKATQLLAKKDWRVLVQLPGQRAVLPIANT